MHISPAFCTVRGTAGNVDCAEWSVRIRLVRWRTGGVNAIEGAILRSCSCVLLHRGCAGFQISAVLAALSSSDNERCGFPYADSTGTLRRSGYRKDLAVTPQIVVGSAVFPAWITFDGPSKISSLVLDFGSEARRSFCGKATWTDRLATEGKPMIMQSVRIKCRGDIADGLVEALLCFGASSCSIEDAHLGDAREQEIFSDGPIPWQVGQRQLWEQSHITAIFPEYQDVGEAIAMASHSIGFNEMPQYEIHLVEDQDWIEQVQNMFEPVEVAAGLWIVPKWRTPPNPAAANVILDPGLAFGTGEHPTTRLCLQFLSQVVRGGERVLDYGTGSGILSIAALKIGASRAVGVDVDPMAISSASYNASLNMIEDHRFQVFQSDVNGGDPVPPGAAYHPVFDNSMDEDKDSRGSDFDIVVANILANPLVELSNLIASYARPGGFVGLSGILIEQVDHVRSTYAQYLDNIQVAQDSGWACITGIRKLTEKL
ncbi:unnamed protein product [Calypogeia fissa]